MAQNPKSNINSKLLLVYPESNFSPVFVETIAHDHFEIISRFLHFSSSVEPNNELRKIIPVVDTLLLSFKKVFTPLGNM